MSYGFQSITSMGTSQISEQGAGLRVVESGYVTTGATSGFYAFTGNLIGSTKTLFLRNVDPADRLSYSLFSNYTTSDNKTTVYVDPGSYYYAICDRTGWVALSSGYGLEVYNESGVPVFSSAASLMVLTTMINLVITPSTPSTTQNFTVVVAPYTGARTYLMMGSPTSVLTSPNGGSSLYAANIHPKFTSDTNLAVEIFNTSTTGTSSGIPTSVTITLAVGVLR